MLASYQSRAKNSDKNKKLSQIKSHKSTKIHSQTPLQNHLNPLTKTYKTQETTSPTKYIKYTKPNASKSPQTTLTQKQKRLKPAQCLSHIAYATPLKHPPKST